MYYVAATSLYGESWHFMPGYRARSIAASCGLDGQQTCRACCTPALQLAGVRAVLAVDLQRAERRGELFEARQASKARRLAPPWARGA